MTSNYCGVATDEFMSTSGLFLLVIVGAETLIGAWINAFIVTICCIDILKNKFLRAADQILMVLATNRFCFLITAMLWALLKTLNPMIYYKNFVFRGVKVILWFFISSNLWLSACLCLFYCVKIATFRHSIFISLKLRIARAVPGLLLGSVLLSLINSLPFLNLIFTTHCDTANATVSGNRTANQTKMHTDLLKVFSFCSFGFSMVLAIFVISALLLLTSLWRHSQQLKNSLTSYTSPRMTAHVRAVKMITYFLVIYLVNFVALMILLTDVFSEDRVEGGCFGELTAGVQLASLQESQGAGISTGWLGKLAQVGTEEVGQLLPSLASPGGAGAGLKPQ
ncbi:taste receptor type 2 member 40-like [Sphaerodactylus townsendi]|uniref:taste receptor type 2 member 40-like n=1 Tax=Sphaerodactylus townsendi TaxID=933632 RepID=UPI0020264739|nr:taste receptor type 2 member 40-like [Sphaerodactylus townsendi]